MTEVEELEPYYHDEFLWIPKDQLSTKNINMDEIMRRMDENE